MSSITFDAVTRFFDREGEACPALRPVTLHVSAGEFVAIVGPSGCGKTTLLRLAAGLDHPTTGSVSVGGRPVTGPGPDRAVVFQQFALLPWKTVRQNIGFGLKCRGMSEAEARPIVDRYLSTMRLEGHGNSYPHQLSGGMQQRVAIARSFILEPEVLLMDEPFGALDAQTRIEMQEELIRLTANQRRTVLFVTHSVEEAIYLADRVVVMAGLPGFVCADVDITALRHSERWEERSVEEVMERDSFIRVRTRLWRLLRSTEADRTEGTAACRLSVVS